VLLCVWWMGAEQRRIPRATAALMLLLGLILSLHWYAFFRSIQLLGVIMGTAMLGLEPIFIALAAAFFLGERLGRRTLVALALSCVGCAVLGSGASASKDLVAGMFWSLFANLSFAGLVVANRVWVQRASPLLVTALQMIGAIPLTLIMMQGSWLPADGPGWLYATMLGLLCTGLAYGFYNGSMKVLPASVVGVMLTLEVVYGVLGGLLVGDTLSLLKGVAAVLIANVLVLDLVLYFRARKNF